jgi:hypothetical protein
MTHNRLARWKVRAGSGLAVAALASGLLVASSPTAALAASGPASPYPCPSAATVAENGYYWSEETIAGNEYYYLVNPNADPSDEFVWTMEVLSYTPTFLVEQEKIVENPSSQTVTATFTSTVSTTVTLTYTLSIVSGLNSTEGGFTNTLSDTIGTSIAESFTTSVGVNAAVAVPPGTSVTGDYGVPAYDVSYQMVHFDSAIVQGTPPVQSSPPSDATCYINDPEQRVADIQAGSAVAPEPADGWLINNPVSLL